MILPLTPFPPSFPHLNLHILHSRLKFQIDKFRIIVRFISSTSTVVFDNISDNSYRGVNSSIYRGKAKVRRNWIWKHGTAIELAGRT